MEGLDSWGKVDDGDDAVKVMGELLRPDPCACLEGSVWDKKGILFSMLDVSGALACADDDDEEEEAPSDGLEEGAIGGAGEMVRKGDSSAPSSC